MTMHKYVETKDLEVVANALREGRRVESAWENGVKEVCMKLPITSLLWAGTRNDPVFAVPGRIFHVEIPRPDPGEGWRLLEPEEDVVFHDEMQISHAGDTIWAATLPTTTRQLDERWYRRRVEAKTPKRNMDKYTETKDLEAVAAALRGGRRVEWDGDEVVIRSGGFLQWEDGGDCLCFPGTVFHIAVPRPPDEDGWRILEPGEMRLNGDEFQYGDAWTPVPQGIPGEQDKAAWYRRRIEAKTPRKKRRRVELRRDDCGALRSDDDEERMHAMAVSRLGFLGYEDEIDGPDNLHLEPCQQVNGKLVFPVAFWVEE